MNLDRALLSGQEELSQQQSLPPDGTSRRVDLARIRLLAKVENVFGTEGNLRPTAGTGIKLDMAPGTGPVGQIAAAIARAIEQGDAQTLLKIEHTYGPRLKSVDDAYPDESLMLQSLRTYLVVAGVLPLPQQAGGTA